MLRFLTLATFLAVSNALLDPEEACSDNELKIVNSVTERAIEKAGLSDSKECWEDLTFTYSCNEKCRAAYAVIADESEKCETDLRKYGHGSAKVFASTLGKLCDDYDKKGEQTSFNDLPALEMSEVFPTGAYSILNPKDESGSREFVGGNSYFEDLATGMSEGTMAEPMSQVSGTNLVKFSDDTAGSTGSDSMGSDSAGSDEAAVIATSVVTFAVLITAAVDLI